jgi:glycosyltransferase involved in cell wall biosynthesis
MSHPDLSIILPLYKQADHIEKIVEDYKSLVKKMGLKAEILLVVNGNSDETYQAAKEKVENDSLFRIFNLKKGGWGLAVLHGLKYAKGGKLCYTNSARTSIDDLEKVLKYAMVADNALVKASRIIRENFVRRVGSVLYNFEFRSLFGVPVWDINGTPKVLPRKIYKKLDLVSVDDLIDAEVIAKCHQYEVDIIEIPIRQTKRISGRSTTKLKSAFDMYRGLFRIRRLVSQN